MWGKRPRRRFTSRVSARRCMWKICRRMACYGPDQTDAGISLSASASQAASKLMFRAHGWREIDGLPDGTGYKRPRERRNGFFQSVLQDEVGKRAFSAVIPMTQQDAMETTQEPHWQTNRTSDCIPAGLMFTDVRRRQENWWHWAPMK